MEADFGRVKGDVRGEKTGTSKAKSGMAQPKFLWQALGWGQGAGEIRKNSKVNSISVDPIGSEIVISHRWGVICLDQDGGEEFFCIRREEFSDVKSAFK